MEAKFSNRVKEVISLSREEALRLGHDYIGTEHLLLGMIREGEGVAVGVLKKLGVPLEELRAELIEQHHRGHATDGVFGSLVQKAAPVERAVHVGVEQGQHLLVEIMSSLLWHRLSSS